MPKSPTNELFLIYASDNLIDGRLKIVLFKTLCKHSNCSSTQNTEYTESELSITGLRVSFSEYYHRVDYLTKLDYLLKLLFFNKTEAAFSLFHISVTIRKPKLPSNKYLYGLCQIEFRLHLSQCV